MRLVFLGTPEAAVASLRALVDAGHEVVSVITRPDARRGRGSKTSPSPVKAAALELGLAVSHDLSGVVTSGAQMGVVVAYGAIIPAEVLERIPMLNVHFSLLPRWRGAAPVERAILAGDERTGVCVMGLEETLDTGPVYARASTEVGEKSAKELTNELATIGAALLTNVLARDPLPEALAQSGEATYARKLRNGEFVLGPDLSVEMIARIVRIGRAAIFVDGRRLRILRAHVGESGAGVWGEVHDSAEGIALGANDGTLVLDEVQPEGGKPMSALAWWSGARLTAGLAQWGSSSQIAP